MDLNFFRRAEQRFASRTAAPLDYGLLVAMLQARQAASAAARAHALWTSAPRLQDPLAELLLGAPLWRRAAAAQLGSFNPACAQQEHFPKKWEPVFRPGSAPANESSAFLPPRGEAAGGKAQGYVN